MNKKFMTMMLAMAALGMVGCSDSLTDEPGTSQDETGSGYIAFTISAIGSETRGIKDEGNDDGTSGEDNESKTPGDNEFNDGIADEFAISSTSGANVVYFFDTNDEFHSFSILEVSGNASDGNDGDYNGNENANKKVYEARVLNNKESIGKCVVVLNGNPEKLRELRDKISRLDDLLAATDNEDLGWGEGTFFTMTNVVYVATSAKNINGVNIAPETIQAATPIDPEKHIFNTQVLAKENPIKVTVERVLAKFELTYTTSESGLIIPGTSTTQDDDPATVDEEDDSTVGDTDNTAKGATIYIYDSEGTASAYNWAVKVIGWGVNATESKTFWVKNINGYNNDWKFGNWGRAYDGTYYGWNDDSRGRSYWAVDPHYASKDDVYPHQYRSTQDELIEDNIVAWEDETETSIALRYKKYSEFNSLGKKEHEGSHYDYAVENTFDGSIFSTPITGETYQFENNDYMRASTHIILAAELYVQGNDDDNYENIGTLYQYNSYYWKAKTPGVNEEGRYADMPEALKKEILSQILFQWMSAHDPIYIDTDGNSQLTSENISDYFTWAEATIKGGDGRVMAKLADESQTKFYDKDGEPMTDLTKFKKIINTYGSARRFNNSQMYYAIPIKHMLGSESYDGVMKYNVGSYGVVRNHWYKVNISSISKPGIPVDDPEQPIIPNDDPDAAAYASFEIVILPWHVIEQSEDL